ncbi:MAG: prolyl oligopeptidase family serine peptidase [Bacteroidales bacterium]
MKQGMINIVLMCFLPLLVSANEEIHITSWLKTGALEVNFPAFHDTENAEGQTFQPDQLLTFSHFEKADYFPEDGKEFDWLSGKQGNWSVQQVNTEGFLQIEDGDPGQHQVTYMAAYVKAGRWLEGQLTLESPYMLNAWLNGEQIGTKTSMEDSPDNAGSITHQFDLPRGTHLLMIKTLRPAGESTEWAINGTLSVKEPFSADDIQAVTLPDNIKNIHHFMDGIKVTNVRPSPDGSMYAVSYRQSLPPSDRSESWTEIRRFDDNGLVHSFRYADVSRITWLPNSNAVSYTTVQDGKTTIHCHHMETGQKRILSEGIAHFSGMQWAPNESYIAYTVTELGSGADDTMRHVQGMQDRQGHFRHRSFLYKLDLYSGIRTRLTYGNQTTSLQDISPDGRYLVFSRSAPDYLERPYSKQDLFMMDIETLAVDTLLADQRWGLSVQFSPDGDALLATGGPSAFDHAGENVPEGMIPNNYDTQAYIFSLDDHSVDPITLDFDPSVVSAQWLERDNNIYILAGDEDYRRLFRYDVRRGRFEQIDTGTDFLTSINYSSNERTATYIGNQVNAPHKAYEINLRNDRFSVLEDFNAEQYRHVNFGEVHEWDFTASTGQEIKGRYYLPPDFDPDQKYPVIVYQYGGTNPVGRTFGGRYPFNLWAGHGYIVYVLQPSGATGFGQEFSAAHVNNWGKTVADEIIEGTEKFLEAHPYADADKVGVAGASYGGFMTMLLLTHTDIFATGISHAGISNIASYWGEGYWGYSYSAEATAERFPWDSEELYVDQSPLYRADQVNTPLLLITGDSDTNVPPGESIQMYTALKMLDRPVELVMVEGEDHHILTYSKRLKWHDTIMAWWDKQLKGEGEWWENQYPEKKY